MTEQEIQAKIDAWNLADTAITKGQNYTIDGQTMTRTDAAAVTSKLKFWKRELVRLQRTNAGLNSESRTPTWNY